MVRPPLFWRFVNVVRAWSERDDRMLVDQWKAAFAQPKDIPKVRPFLNLRVMRSASRKVA
jgi:hypothetical protein